MIVVARNNRKGIFEGKEYEVICYYKPGSWIQEYDDFINPMEAKFYIVITDEDGCKSSYWNDYFLSTEEMREFKLKDLVI